MKKTAFLINSLGNGGAEKVVLTLGRELSKECEEQIDLILLEKIVFYDIPSGININYISNLKGDENIFTRIFFLPIIIFNLYKYIKKNNVKVLQSHLYKSNFINVILKIIGSKHEAQIVNHDIFFTKTKTFTEKLRTALVKILYRRADDIITISQFMKINMEKLLGREVKLINNPYDINEINEKSKENINKFKFNNNKIYIISVGRLVKIKRNKDIIRVFNELEKKYSNVELIFLGDGNELINLKKLSEKFGLNKKTHFLGRVKNPYKYMKKSDILVLTSEIEGFPNVIIEGLACNCAIVSNDCESGPREILSLDETESINRFKFLEFGVIYEFNNIEFLKKSLEELIKDKKKLHHYKNIGLKRAKDFDKEIIKEKYLDLL